MVKQDPALRARLKSTLNKLGKTTDEIVANSHLRGITGKCGYETDCPLVNYLRLQRVYADAYVKVSKYFVEVSSDSIGGSAIIVPLPKAVKSFVEEFDKGRYPELIDKS
ncbi:MAG: hypothetical protein KGL39_00540 [Patescibacteria group bacterium]|nr:hypothetical protein [Patescibacteria group bacterium]